MPKNRPEDREFFIVAPAKVNLLLSVDWNVENGRHPVTTVMQAISLCDRMHAKVVWDKKNPGVSIDLKPYHGVQCADIPLEDNLVYKAIMAFVNHIGKPLEDRISIELQKGIPSQSGFGGGSSDCAVAIAFMAMLYGLEPTGEEAYAVARELGTDIAFFLRGGTALLSGYGDVYEGTLPSPNMYFVVARPNVGLGTGDVYRKFDELNAGKPRGDKPERDAKTKELVDALRNEAPAKNLASLLLNNLQEPACEIEPEVAHVIYDLRSQPEVLNAMISGSGSASFGVCESREDAARAASRMRELGWWALDCQSVPCGVNISTTMQPEI
ncbi:MAG: 4-(cytidine 5'-diphospho)-2-C-methyl-D-erythritol kinase [Coriobacteriales bacterium]|jgi:4-diphosphocytidyl-2-C-methyl-D-erythritol kinase